MTPPTKFTIDRSKWLNASTRKGYDSRLLRKFDGLMCCLGQIASQCGIPDEALRENITLLALDKAYWSLLPTALRPVTPDSDELTTDTETAAVAMITNDFSSKFLTATDREKMLTAHFAEQGIELEFINQLPDQD
jgi:hypothetical protein